MIVKSEKLEKIIRNRAGASYIFVLGAMLLLLTIGVSVLAAAGANINAARNQARHTGLRIVSDSIQKNINYALRNETGSDLSRYIAKAVYEESDPNFEMELLVEFDELSLVEYGLTAEIKITIPERSVDIREAIAPVFRLEEYVDDETGEVYIQSVPDLPREPRTASINAEIYVTVKVTGEMESLVTRSVYKYTGGMLSDDIDGEYEWHTEEDIDYSDLEMEFVSGRYGEWEISSYAYVDF